MKLSLVIEAVDKASARIKRITGDVRGLGTRGMGAVQRATQGANRELGRFGSGFVSKVRSYTVSAARFAGRMGLKAIEKSAYGAGYAIGTLIRKGAQLTLTAAKWGVATGGFLAGWGIGEIIKTGAQFEDFQAVLEGTEGSADKAKKALAWVQKFAKDTPYELTEVTDAFVRARGAVIDPMGGAFTAIGDAASGARKSIMEAVEAVADAQSKEFDRLKAFNITTSVAGSKVAFSYLNRAGKSMTRTISNDMRDIQRTVIEIFGEKYAGAMIRRSRTLSGIWSNIKDTAKGFLLQIANAGFFDVVKSKLQQVLDKMNNLAADGTLAKWAKNISDWLSFAVEKSTDFIKNSWPEVKQDLKNVGTLVWWIAKGLSWIVSLVSKAAAGIRWMSNTRTSDWLGLTTPDKTRPFYVPSSGKKGWPSEVSNRLAPIQSPRAPLKSGHQPIIWPDSSRSGRNASIKTVPVGGRVEIELKGAGARDAHVRSVQTANSSVPISVSTNRGRAMENFA